MFDLYSNNQKSTILKCVVYTKLFFHWCRNRGIAFLWKKHHLSFIRTGKMPQTQVNHKYRIVANAVSLYWYRQSIVQLYRAADHRAALRVWYWVGITRNRPLFPPTESSCSSKAPKPKLPPVRPQTSGCVWKCGCVPAVQACCSHVKILKYWKQRTGWWFVFLFINTPNLFHVCLVLGFLNSPSFLWVLDLLVLGIPNHETPSLRIAE